MPSELTGYPVSSLGIDMSSELTGLIQTPSELTGRWPCELTGRGSLQPVMSHVQ